VNSVSVSDGSVTRGLKGEGSGVRRDR